jgi:uncharacterized membrane protein YfhO
LAVFSEIYYANSWNVYVDGKKSDYFRPNYLLRAMSSPSGKHAIKFKLEPKIIQTCNKIAAASSILHILLFLGSIYFGVKNRKSPILPSPKIS